MNIEKYERECLNGLLHEKEIHENKSLIYVRQFKNRLYDR